MLLITPDSPLYLASSNPGKLREFSAAALARGIRVEPLPGFKSLPACIEDGNSFEENARKKALHYSAFVSGAVFADDSGISVDALGGAPGIFSARFAGPDATDDENNLKLMEELARGRLPIHPSCALRLRYRTGTGRPDSLRYRGKSGRRDP